MAQPSINPIAVDQEAWDRLLIDAWVKDRYVIAVVKLYLFETQGLYLGRQGRIDIDQFREMPLLRAPGDGDFGKLVRPFVSDHCPQMSACLFDRAPAEVLAAIDRFKWSDSVPRSKRSRGHYSKDEFNNHHGIDLTIRFRDRDKGSDWKTVK